MEVGRDGGVHADDPLDFQEFMTCCMGSTRFAQPIDIAVEVYWRLREVLRSRELGGERGFALPRSMGSGDPALGPRWPSAVESVGGRATRLNPRMGGSRSVTWPGGRQRGLVVGGCSRAPRPDRSLYAR